ncbi:MAG: NAD(P)H-hydrate dehydratase [Symbiopectobacterium sp.]|uniref:NAD(P)H-hydrate dehydratase n=1 Tax=Symbiopectobacterium sp. TaxID=2952789 RepID=UPI003F349D18
MALIDVGNPGIASGGMGDVLSGIIGALLGQNCHATQRLALAEQRGTRGMLATDLMPVLSRYVNPEWIPLEKTE